MKKRRTYKAAVRAHIPGKNYRSIKRMRTRTRRRRRRGIPGVVIFRLVFYVCPVTEGPSVAEEYLSRSPAAFYKIAKKGREGGGGKKEKEADIPCFLVFT